MKGLNPGEPKGEGFFDVLFNLFRSVRLTIFLLILLAILSILGTIITQNASKAEYIQRYGVKLYEILNFFNLFDMYHSWWFSAILLLLVINLIACSLHRFPGVWRQIFKKPTGLEDSLLKTLPYVEKIQGLNPSEQEIFGEIQSCLRRWVKNPKRIETEKSTTLYFEKGRLSRLGVYLTHLSILIILVGGLMGSIFGFKGFVNILEGETVNHFFLRTRDGEVSRPMGFSIRCDDFEITYYDLQYPEKLVKEYISHLTILEDGKEVLKKSIKVNHPLHYKGLAIYQATYGKIHDVTIGVQWKGSREKVFFQAPEGEIIPIPNSKHFIRVLRYAPEIHNFGEGVQVALFKLDQEPRAFWLLKNFPNLDQKRGDEFTLTFEKVQELEYTGLQVTKDPGVWIVWVGCSLMIIGLIVSFFFSHQRVWLRIPKRDGEEIILAGTTNRNRVGFEKFFAKMTEAIRRIERQ